MVGGRASVAHKFRHCQKERREAKEERALSSVQGKESDRLSPDQLALGFRYCDEDYPALVPSGSHPPPAQNSRSCAPSRRCHCLCLHSGHLGVPHGRSFGACR